MWDADTKPFLWADLSLQKKKLLESLLAEFSIPEKGIAIVLDENDYPGYPNRIWRNQGLHINIKLGGIEEMSPVSLLDIMQSKDYSNLVWISNRVSTGDSVQFAWVISHELQHFVQDQICHILSVANSFLFNNLSHNSIVIDEPKEAMTIPYDFDSELAAFKKVKTMLGDLEADRFIRSPQNYNRLKRLLDYDLTKPYDILGQTIQFFEKYRDQLENYVNSASDPFISSFNIDRTIRELKEYKK